MKQFCPNCEKETECLFSAELYECTECNKDFERSCAHYVAALEQQLAERDAEVARLKAELTEWEDHEKTLQEWKELAER